MKQTALTLILAISAFAADSPKIPTLTAEQKLQLTQLQLRATRDQDSINQANAAIASAKQDITQAAAEWNEKAKAFCGQNFIVKEESGSLMCSAVKEEKK